jgi:hypothetical protein
MSKKRGQIAKPDVNLLAASHIHPNEIVESSSHASRTQFSIWLIDRELAEICRDIGSSRGGGTGRTLEFRWRNDHWKFAGEGFWIS